MRRWMRMMPAVLAALLTWTAAAEDFFVIPYKSDPPITVDGRLDDWSSVPNPIVLDRKEQVTYGADTWSGPADLSGVVRLAWRDGGLYIAAEVTDDLVNQPYRGGGIYNGDHVNLWMDFIPGQDPQRTMFGKGQFHVVFSPGNLGGPDGRETVTPPEIHVYRPEGLPTEGGEIVARRTATGYVIEAYLPWTRVDAPNVKRNQDANFEVALGETDASPARQEALMTVGTEPWVYTRKRMLPVVFGDANGKGEPPARGNPIPGALQIAPGEDATVVFAADPLPEGKTATYFFKARLDARQVSGVREKALRVEVNGHPIEAARLANRNAVSRFFKGDLAAFASPDGAFGLYRAPSFAVLSSNHLYHLMDFGPGAEYELSLEGLVRPGENTVVFRNCVAPGESDGAMHVGEMELRVKAKPLPPAALRPAPEGELPLCAPQRTFPRTWRRLSVDSDRIRLAVGDERFEIVSRFSTPDGQWTAAKNPWFRHRREVVRRDEWIEVRDTFRNLTGDVLPLMQEHTLALGPRLKRLWLGGLEVPDRIGRYGEADNPSAFATVERAGIGLMPHSDAFLVHMELSAADGAVTLADRSFALEPNAEYTAVWLIVPVPAPDFWAFINQARRARDVNFPLRWMFAFMSQRWPIYDWSDDLFRDFIRFKAANFVVISNNLAIVQGRHARCTEFYSADLKAYRDFFARFHRLMPEGDVKTGVYYHCFLDSTPENATRFADDRALDQAGHHIDYGGTYAWMKAYVPTLRPGSWGDEIAKWIDLILDDFKADGVFWDEFVRTRGSYVYNAWDRCSADIDPVTHQVAALKGSTTLLSLPFRYYHVKRILDRGAPFVINGAPFTRTLVDLHFQAFTETGSHTACRRMLLHSPVALGDSLTERTEEDAYRFMLHALNHGCLYAWYDTRIVPTHPTLTEHMFPFTPIELHEGWVVGEERILTNRSGLFGWNDASDFVAHVYDREGRETQAVPVYKVVRDGKTYAEVRIAEGYSVAIVRNRPAPRL